MQLKHLEQNIKVVIVLASLVATLSSNKELTLWIRGALIR